MKESLTELVFILDRSGSMYSLTSDTIGGFNSLIEKQKAQPGDADVTTVLFDDEYEILHDHLPLREIRPLTEKEYCVQGCTALLDAVGMTINAVGARLNNTPENERPGKVVVVIVTDGLENASHEYTKAQVKKMITHQQEKYSWDFIFLGANIDAAQEASSLGIRRDFARNYEASKEGDGTPLQRRQHELVGGAQGGTQGGIPHRERKERHVRGNNAIAGSGRLPKRPTAAAGQSSGQEETEVSLPPLPGGAPGSLRIRNGCPSCKSKGVPPSGGRHGGIVRSPPADPDTRGSFSPGRPEPSR